MADTPNRPLIRPEVLTLLRRWREGIVVAAVVGVGLWLMRLGGWVLIPVGAALAMLGLGLGVLAWRRMRFAQAGDAPGLVEVDEAQISYFGAQVGGYVALPDLVELRLVSFRGQRFWRLRQADGQALLIPVAAAGAGQLFDAFASLPGMDSQALVAALDPLVAAQPGRGVAPASAEIGPVIWRRPAHLPLT